MEIRPITLADLGNIPEIDGTVESSHYLRLERSGQGLGMQWKLEERPLRAKLIESNPLDDMNRLLLKQIATGADEGVGLTVDLQDMPVAMLLAQPRPERGVLKLLDLRVDFDYRRQGLGTALIYQLIERARALNFRAAAAQTLSNNFPASALLLKCGFELAGVDAQRNSNHDLVKEAVTLFWYAPLDQ